MNIDRIVRIARRTLVLATVGALLGSASSVSHAQGTASKPPAAKSAAKKNGPQKPPAKAKRAPADPQAALFLTPGGRYTAADITANGRKTVAQKYPNFMAAHDAKPKPGDRVCPITDTKANPKLTWVVSGQTYQFCCPPCVVEFVKKAKTNPQSIKAPDAYIKAKDKG